MAGQIRTQLSRAESCSARVLSKDKYGRGCPSWVNAWCLIIQWGTMMFDNWPLGMYIVHTQADHSSKTEELAMPILRVTAC